MVNNKRQHWIPNSYLNAWVDPATPPGQTPYVHLFDRYGGNHRTKSPKKIFKMPDLYTIWQDGERDLRIEQVLSKWEADFVRARGVIETQKICSNEDAADFYAFVGAMIVRPPHRIELVKNQWASIARKMQNVRINPNTAPPPTLSTGPAIDLTQVQELADNPMGTWFPDMIGTHVEVISNLLAFDILVNDTEHPFLTSDAPAVIWHPPADSRRPFPRGLASTGCEITLPLSPRFALLFRHKEEQTHEFLEASWERVFEINFRTITRARQSIVSDREDIFFVRSITQRIADVDSSCVTREALADVDAGRVIDRQAVQSWAESLDDEKPLPLPR